MIQSSSSDKGDGDFGQKPKPEPIKAFGGGRWEKKGNMPNTRGGFPAIVVDGKIYAFGGWKVPVGLVPTVNVYNPATDTWTKKRDMPTTRSAAAAAMVNGKIYVIGGFRGDRQITTVEEYDPKTDTWTKKADMRRQDGVYPRVS